MVETFSLNQVLCRPILARDLDDIKGFCKTIWDGHDYVPNVIDDWFQDSQGILAVAEYEGHAIACSKVTWLAKGQWWLEGFRVDPKYQGLKVGSLIHHYIDEWWLAHGKGILRLMTSSKNKTVHHLCESTGYTRLFEVRGYRAEPLDEPVDTFFSAAKDPDLKNVTEFALQSPSLRLTNHVVDFGWRLVRFAATQDRALTELFSPPSGLAGNLFWWRKDQGLLITWEDYDPNEEEYTMGIGVLACQLEDMPAFLTDVRRLAAEQGKTSIFWLAPIQENVEFALRKAGFSSEWENTAYVFEKKQPQDLRKIST